MAIPVLNCFSTSISSAAAHCGDRFRKVILFSIELIVDNQEAADRDAWMSGKLLPRWGSHLYHCIRPSLVMFKLVEVRLSLSFWTKCAFVLFFIYESTRNSLRSFALSVIDCRLWNFCVFSELGQFEGLQYVYGLVINYRQFRFLIIRLSRYWLPMAFAQSKSAEQSHVLEQKLLHLQIKQHLCISVLGSAFLFRKSNCWFSEVGHAPIWQRWCFFLRLGATVPKDDGLHKRLHELLLQYFGYSSFRGQQLQAIETVLQGTFSLPWPDCFIVQ